MFETITIVVFLATIASLVVHWFAYPVSAECPGVGRGLIRILSMLLIEQRASTLGALKKLCYIVSVICFLLLGLTGFYPLLVRGEHISGWPMMLHATLAPVFAICLAIIALTWASRYRFAKADWPWLRKLLRRVTRLTIPAEEAEGPCKCAITTQKVTFWAILVLALPLILSVVLSMLHLFGTHGQHIAMAAHRWTALIFAVAVLIHTYVAIRLRMTQ